MRITAVLIVLLLTSMPGHAWRSPCCSDFESGFELLYFRPPRIDRVIAIEEERSIDEIAVQLPDVDHQGQTIKIRTGQSLGWRVFVGFINKGTCCDVRAEYTMHHAKRSKDAIVDPQSVYWPTLDESLPLVDGAPPAEQALRIDGLFRNNLDAFDLSLGTRCNFRQRLWVRAFVSLHYVFLAERYEASYQGFTAQEFFPGSEGRNVRITLVDRQRTWGIGPRVGIQGYYCLSQNFSLSGRVIGGVLAGDCRIHRTEWGRTQFIDQEPVPVDFSHRSPLQHSAIPTVDLRAGLAYSVCELACFSALVEAGYEYLAYFYTFRSDSCEYTLHGPYFRVWLAF